MQINRSSMLSDLKKALPGIDTGKSTIQGADAFLFSGNYIHTFNSHIGVSIPTVTEGMEVAVKASEFYKMLTKAGTDDVVLDLEDGIIKCKMGRFKSKMSPIASNIGTYVNSLGIDSLEFAQLPEGFCDGLRLCRVPESQLGGVYIKDNYLIATDGCVSTMFTFDPKMPNVWLPDSAIKAMLKVGDPTSYAIGQSWAHFRFADGTVFSCSTLAVERYPGKALRDRLGMCERDDTCVGGKLPDGLAEAIGRVAIFSETRNGTNPIEVELRKDALVLKSSKAGGECEEEIPWGDAWGGEDISCVLDAGVLLECYRKGVEFYIKTIGECRVIVFTSENFIQATEI